MKIAVYSCALNEAKFAARWAESAKDADQRYVLDTGSTDDTVSILADHGVPVAPIRIKPWRFDLARNAGLALLPPDIDVCIQLDLDEVLMPNWRKNLEAAWTPETTRLHYKYVWSHMPDGTPDKVFFSDKIARRFTHIWKHPVHEVLMPTVPEVVTVCDQILISHYPDPAKTRSNYLALLALSVQEDPLADRNSHYYGRELYFHGHYEAAIKELTRHLALPNARWACERAASMRYGAKCYEALGKVQEAKSWFTSACSEDPQSREALIDIAMFLSRQKIWPGVLYYATAASQIPGDQSSYINERYSCNEGPYDLASLALWHMGHPKHALVCAKVALEKNPTDQRLQNNVALLEVPDALPPALDLG